VGGTPEDYGRDRQAIEGIRGATKTFITKREETQGISTPRRDF
jgi:hypothetical protein